MAEACAGEDFVNIDKEWAEGTLEEASKYVAEIVEKFSDFGRAYGAPSESVCNEGCALIDSFTLAAANLGSVDVRHLNKEGLPLLDQIQAFLSSALGFNEDKQLKTNFLLGKIKENGKKLDELLNKPWNCDLPDGNITVVIDEKKTDGGGDKHIFKLATPLKDKASFTCEDCPYSVSNHVVFKRHVKAKHGKIIKVEAPKVTCKLPHQQGGTRVTDRHTMDQICSHLKQVHKIEKPSPKHEFRGFESIDKGVTWSPVFRLKHELNPVSTYFDTATSTSYSSQSLLPSCIDAPRKNLLMNPDFNKEDSVDLTLNKDESVDNNSAEASEVVIESDKEKNSTQLVLDKKVLSPVAVPPPVHKDSLELNAFPTEVESNLTVGESNSKVIPQPEKEKNSNIFDIDDELCGSYEEKEGAIEEDLRTAEDDFDEDSDIESDDEDVFTFARLRNKTDRYRHRNNPDKVLDENLPENKPFIEKFVAYIRKTSTTRNKKSSTISLSTSLLFRHDDSFLVYRKKKNPSFSLDRLVCFNDLSRFVELKDPSSWIDEIGGEDGRDNAIRRKEMFKAYKRLCRFVLKILGDTDFGTDLLSIVRRDKIRTSLKDIIDDIDKDKTWTKLQRIIDSDRVETQKAKATIDPNQKHNAATANKTYFASPEFRNRLNKCQQSYEKSLASDKISGKDVNMIGNFARHLLVMTDRNRSASYNFKNSDFASRQPVWFPEGHNADKFDGLPENWNMFEKPSDGREPDAWILDLSSNEEILKLGVDVNITLFKLAHEWCNKYRDVKNIKWKDMKDEEYFFVNNQRKRFGPMNRTTILNEFAKVTGLKNVTVNSFRRAMEPTIQGDHAMRTRSKDIASHSVQTGSKYYDESAATFRCSAMHFINEGEIEYETQTDVPEEIQSKRLKLDEEGKKTNLEKARLRVEKDPSKRKATTGKSSSVVPADRVFMQTAFGKDGVYSDLSFHVGKFPGVADFRRSFYRIVDGYEVDENVERMRSIEERVYRVVRNGKDFNGDWDGSLESNKKADKNVASVILNSFKIYEKKRKGDGSFFKF